MESDMRQVGDLENGNHFLTNVVSGCCRSLLSNNGSSYTTLLKTETARLNALIASAERDLDNDDVPEDVRGKLRVGVGKAKMLLRKKFTQFKDLCFKNLGYESDVRYPVTCEDLAGYWDTIVIQILQVYKIFEEVEDMRKNNWEEPKIKPISQSREKKLAAKLNVEKKVISEAV